MKTLTKTLVALSITGLFSMPALAQESGDSMQLQTGEAEGEQVQQRVQERVQLGGEAQKSGDKPAYQHRNRVMNSEQGEQHGELVTERVREEERLQSQQDPKSAQAKKQIGKEQRFEGQSGGSRMGGGGGGKR